MSPEADRTCKRCSVARVNALIKAYGKAHGKKGERFAQRLRKLTVMCSSRGYKDASRLLQAGLDEKELRALCWNISSFLKDEQVEAALGIKL